MKLKNLISGRVSLGLIFWLFGVLIWVLLYVVFSLYSLRRSIVSPLKTDFVIDYIFMIYTFLAACILWLSAKNYKGKKIWVIIVKLYSAMMVIVILILFIIHFIPLSINPNTSVVTRNLHPTAQMPYVGFWKEKSWYQFGVAIAPAENGLYSVSFCGPGGCFEPGTWNCNTKLINDPCYKIIDENTIEFISKDGSTIYKRMTESPPK